jgi:hypothetical protein
MRLLSLLLACGGLLPAHAELTWTQLEVEQTPEPLAKVQEFLFTAVNKGKTPVNITAVTPGCGCLTASTDHTLIPAGGTVTLTATMELGQMQGEQKKQIVVSSKDVKEHWDTLVASAKLEYFYEIAGRVAKFEQGTAGTPHTATIKVLGKDSLKLKIAQPSDGAVTAKLEETVPGREFRVVISPADLSKKGMGSVTLTTDSPYPRAQHIELFYTIVAPRKPQ